MRAHPVNSVRHKAEIEGLGVRYYAVSDASAPAGPARSLS